MKINTAPKHAFFLRSFLTVSFICGFISQMQSAPASSLREKISFNKDWLFFKEDAPEKIEELKRENVDAWLQPMRVPLKTAGEKAVRPEGNLGESLERNKPAYDDEGWRKVNLPHDWGIEGPFEQDLAGETGKLPWFGVAWYRKYFEIPSGDKGKRIYLDIDGAMSNALVWVNGQFAGGWRYGYSSFRVDLTPYLNAGGKNVLAIRLDNPDGSSRWYPGGGLYRNVWLVKTPPLHVAHWGTQISTTAIGAESAEVELKVTVDNDSDAVAYAELDTEIYALDATGKEQGAVLAGTTAQGKQLQAGERAVFQQKLNLPQPKLWSVDEPHLYVAVNTLRQDGRVADVYRTNFGVRSIEFTVKEGFLLNGKVLKIQGVCNHHDLGALGAAISTRALERQIELLKEMGCNAIRTSHNPPAPELLDLCDRMGMLLQVEAFDCWAGMKKPNDYHLAWKNWFEPDLRAMIRRDRNHPSVFMWSTGNEIVEQSGGEFSSMLTAIVHEEDRTRPVTVGCNWNEAGFNGFQKSVDVFGYNYKPGTYAEFRKKNPEVPLYGSETASTISSRGEYFFPLNKDGRQDFQMSSYDLYYPGWATTPDTEFAAQDRNPFVAGEFVWTGFDYLGEPTPYNSDNSNLLNIKDPAEREKLRSELERLGKLNIPSRSSYFGILDLAGFKKDRFYLYQARWRPELPMAHILPHWNWPERAGEITPVHVYTSGDEAELFLNGKSQGRKKKEAFQYRLRWDEVKYEPGELKVVVYKRGKAWAKDLVKTTGKPEKVLLSPDRKEIRADGKDLSYVTVSIADASGTVVPRSKNLVKFEISGPGEIVAADNGDATSHESFQAKERRAFNGLALVIVRAKEGQKGKMVLRARSEGLEEGETVILSK